MKRNSAPKRGEAFVLADPDYRYGVGPILAHIVEVHGEVEYHGEPWWSVAAEVAQGTPDNRGPWIRRDLYIREATFPKTRQVPKV